MECAKHCIECTIKPIRTLLSDQKCIYQGLYLKSKVKPVCSSGGILFSFSVMEIFGRMKERFLFLWVNDRSCTISIFCLRPVHPHFCWHLVHVSHTACRLPHDTNTVIFLCVEGVFFSSRWRKTIPMPSELCRLALTLGASAWVPVYSLSRAGVSLPLVFLLVSRFSSLLFSLFSVIAPCVLLPPSPGLSHLYPSPFLFSSSFFLLPFSHLFIKTHQCCRCLLDFSWFWCDDLVEGLRGRVCRLGALESRALIFL